MLKALLRSLTILLFIAAPLVSQAGTIRGTVHDKNGAVLPFVTIFVKGTTIGTATNADGQYQLTVEPGTYTIICQYISYQQESVVVKITGSEIITHNFTLAAQDYQMKEVVVKSGEEDPGYRIMRRVIAQRAFHLKQVKAFQTSIYLKGVMRSRKAPAKVLGQKVDARDLGIDSAGKGVLYLCEEVADYYAQAPNRERTVIHSVRQSGDPNGLGFSTIPPVISFYENNVNLGENLNPRGFVSPLADGALGFYRYKLQGEFTEGQHIIYKIGVTPKHDFEPLFVGTVYIVDGDWALHSLSLTTTGKLGMEFLDSLRLEQVFLQLKHDNWVVKSQLYYPVIDILGFGITGNFVTVYDNQKVNEPVPDSIFKTKIVSQYDKEANKRDTAYWEAERPIPLEVDEARDYRYKDSLLRHDTAFAYTDSIRRAANRKLSIGGLLLTGKTWVGKRSYSTFGTSAILYSASYNVVEGFNVEPQFTYQRRVDSSNNIRLRTALRYGFENTHFNPVAALSFIHRRRDWRTRGWTATLIGGSYVYQYNPDNPVLPLFNTYTTLVSGDNNLKIYERREITPVFTYNGGNGFRWSARASYQERIPLENTVAFTFKSGNEASLTPNYPPELARYPFYRHKAMVAQVSLYYQPGMRYTLLPDGRRPVPSDAPEFSLVYTKGIPDVGESAVDYDKWRLGITGDVRLRLAGSFSYAVYGGGFLNNKSVFAPDLMHLYDGDDSWFTLASAYLKGFQLSRYYRYSNDEPLYGEAHIEYNLHGLITNKVPLLKQAKWYLIFGANAFYANPQLNVTEAYVSLDNIGFKQYRFFRLDYVHTWDGFGRSYDGLRVGLRGIKFVRGGGETEW